MSPAFDVIGLTQLRNDSQFSSLDGSGLSVVVVDTGLDTNHDLLAPNYVTGFDFVENSEEVVDTDGHGTHIAGIIGAESEDIGIAPGVGLIGLRVFAQTGDNVSPPVEDALDWVLTNQEEYNIVAVNISSGSGFFTSPGEFEGNDLADKIQELEDEGIAVISAAGNNYPEREEPGIATPGIYSTLAVGATWQDAQPGTVRWQSGAIDFSTDVDRLVSFSQRLQAPNMLFAPGAIITSTLPDNELGEKAGTSMATPMVTGTVALMQQAALEFGGRLLTPEEIADLIQSTADTIFDGDDEDDNVENTQLEYPRLNTYEAVLAVQEAVQIVLTGTAGADLIEGVNFPERLLGYGGDDELRGNYGDDTLIGGPGDDLLFGGPGQNFLVGGEGSDRLVMAAPSGEFDRLRDFEIGSDLIVLFASGFDLEVPLRETLPSELFSIGSPDTQDESRPFIYDPDLGQLWFNDEPLAVLTDQPALTHRDIFIV